MRPKELQAMPEPAPYYDDLECRDPEQLSLIHI